MTKQNKQDQIINSLKEKIGEKVFNKTQIIANSKFGNKEGLKSKFYQSILDGYINPSELWVSDDTVSLLKEKIESAPDNEKEQIIVSILDGVYNDTSDPKIRELLRKYERYLKKIHTGLPKYNPKGGVIIKNTI